MFYEKDRMSIRIFCSMNIKQALAIKDIRISLNLLRNFLDIIINNVNKLNLLFHTVFKWITIIHWLRLFKDNGLNAFLNLLIRLCHNKHLTHFCVFLFNFIIIFIKNYSIFIMVLNNRFIITMNIRTFEKM